jgi:hypothetical protein
MRTRVSVQTLDAQGRWYGYVFEWCGHILCMSISEVGSEGVQRGILMSKLRACGCADESDKGPSE